MPIDPVLDSYDYARDAGLATLRLADAASRAAMQRYGGPENAFGAQLVAHQDRTAALGSRLLRQLGYSDRAARNFQAGMAFHDIGKTHLSYDPAIWRLLDRPTPTEKALQKRHAQLGADMFEELAETIDGFAEHPHFAVRHAVTREHHERMDGKGPGGRSTRDMPLFVRIACLVDAYDGDLIPRPHQAAQRTPQQELERLASDEKYAGAFDPSVLAGFLSMQRAAPVFAG